MVELHRHGLPIEAAIEPELLRLADAAVPAARGHQRRASSPPAGDARGARRAALHRRGPDAGRERPPPGHAANTGSSRPRRCGRCSPTCPTPATTRWRWPAAARSWRRPASPCCRSARRSGPAAPRRRRCGRWPSRGWPARMDARGADAATRAAATHERLEYELGVIERMGFPGYFLIVADFIQWAKAQRHPGGAGARVRRRVGRGLGADHHRHRPAAVRPAVRALPEPRTRVDAGLRHRFLPGPARRGDRLRAPRIRRRPGRADHHLRQVAGARRGARRRPRARPCRTARSTGSPS